MNADPALSWNLLGIPDPQYYTAIGRCAAACCAVFSGREDTGIWKTCMWCGRQVMMIEGDDDKPEFIWTGRKEIGNNGSIHS